MENVLGSFSYFNIETVYSNFTFCGSCTLSFLALHRISVKLAHPWYETAQHSNVLIFRKFGHFLCELRETGSLSTTESEVWLDSFNAKSKKNYWAQTPQNLALVNISQNSGKRAHPWVTDQLFSDPSHCSLQLSNHNTDCVLHMWRKASNNFFTNINWYFRPCFSPITIMWLGSTNRKVVAILNFKMSTKHRYFC